MRRFGALRTAMSLPCATFAFAGWQSCIPPFSGFFSKDKIIEAAFSDPFAGHEAVQAAVFGIVTMVAAPVLPSTCRDCSS